MIIEGRDLFRGVWLVEPDPLYIRYCKYCGTEQIRTSAQKLVVCRKCTKERNRALNYQYYLKRKLKPAVRKFVWAEDKRCSRCNGVLEKFRHIQKPVCKKCQKKRSKERRMIEIAVKGISFKKLTKG